MIKYYTTRQTARLLQINIATVYGLIKEKKLKAHKLGGNGNSKRHWRISENDLEQFIIGVHNAGSVQDKETRNNKSGSFNLPTESTVQ